MLHSVSGRRRPLPWIYSGKHAVLLRL